MASTKTNKIQEKSGKIRKNQEKSGNLKLMKNVEESCHIDMEFYGIDDKSCGIDDKSCGIVTN